LVACGGAQPFGKRHPFRAGRPVKFLPFFGGQSQWIDKDVRHTESYIAWAGKIKSGERLVPP
jgi:hypothetical protein